MNSEEFQKKSSNEKIEKLRKVFSEEIIVEDEENVEKNPYVVYLAIDVKGVRKKVKAYKPKNKFAIIEENPFVLVCENCGKDFGVSVLNEGAYNLHCPYCNEIYIVSKTWKQGTAAKLYII